MFAATTNHSARRLVVVGMLVLAFLVGALLAAAPSDGARIPTSHVVRQGETIMHRNSLADATIQPGETLVLP